MDDRLILVKCITLLYRESMLVEKQENSADLVRTILETIKLPEYNLSINHASQSLQKRKEERLLHSYFLTKNLTLKEFMKQWEKDQ